MDLSSSKSSLPVPCVLIIDCEPSFAERPDRKESVEWNIKEQIDSSQWIDPGLFIDLTEFNISLPYVIIRILLGSEILRGVIHGY